MLPVKDHYKILNIPFSATQNDIKKAFRKLALQYHPDKNNDIRSAEKFMAIEYAYNILSNAKSKAEYDHALLAQSGRYGSHFSVSTPTDILVLAEKLSGKIQRIDISGINRDLLAFEIHTILSEYNMDILNKANDTVTNRIILKHIIASARPLAFTEITDIIEKLKSITNNDSLAEKELHKFINDAKQQYYWNRYKIYLALAIAALFCLIVFYSVKV